MAIGKCRKTSVACAHGVGSEEGAASDERPARLNDGNPFGDTLLGRMSTTEKPEHPPEVLPGQVVGGKWRIVAAIGRGGMGAVYEGQNISIGKKVALKFIDAEFARQPEVASRF